MRALVAQFPQFSLMQAELIERGLKFVHEDVVILHNSI